MVSKVQASKADPDQRNMLTHSGSKAHHPHSAKATSARSGLSARLDRTSRQKRGTDYRAGVQPRGTKLDPISLTFVTLLVAGLVFIALAAWLTYVLALRGTDAWNSGTGYNVSLRVLHVERTRDAQQLEIASLKSELDRVRRELATVSVQATSPTATPHPISTSRGKPPLALILDAPVYKQQHSLSCESSAAAMAANFYGISISEEDILAALPRHENPHLGFRGNVDGPRGGINDYGVYAEPIRQALARWGLEVEHFSGGPNAIREHIRQGQVVIAWITFDLQAQFPRQVRLSDGQTITLIPYEHTVLIVGYNRNGLWVNDPYAGTQTFYPENDFVRSFAYLGNMGLVVGPPAIR